MFSILLSIQVLVSVAIISLVMLQQGKGADMGAAFGSGASGTVFGARGSGSFFTRATAILATVFFINCILIASPMVRDTTRPDETLAEKLEQQAIEQQAAEAAAAAQAEQGISPDDMPGDPVTMQPVPEGQAGVQAPAAQQAADLPAAAEQDSGAGVADEKPLVDDQSPADDVPQ